MIHLIPRVKQLDIQSGTLQKKAVCLDALTCDERVRTALAYLPQDAAGAAVSVTVTGDAGESYELWIGEWDIRIEATGAAGAFYAAQTLRQIFRSEEIPCLHIKDEPDFPYRGFYHDITRGRVPTLATLKAMVDKLAYYKVNAFQLYVEHTYPFEEYADIVGQTGCITPEELRELDVYCRERFIDFTPSLATFGHLYELLHQEKYRHMCVLKDEVDEENFWRGRGSHHTINPLVPDSIETIKHLIDQYIPNFTSDLFNICCDETFDLHKLEALGHDTSRLYVDFVKQIISHVSSRGKTVMMWADILLQHPEIIDELPEDVYFLNWDYADAPNESKVAKFAELGRRQIVCPSTRSWNRLCENVQGAEQNISRMAEYGYKHGALGLLNTNWGDTGHACDISLAMYGMVLGAAKAWAVETAVDDEYRASVDALLYENEHAVQYLQELSSLQNKHNWYYFANNYFDFRYKPEAGYHEFNAAGVADAQAAYKALADKLSGERWTNDEYRQKMLVAAEGICLAIELDARMHGMDIERLTDAGTWLPKYREVWLATCKPSELYRLEEMFSYLEENL